AKLRKQAFGQSLEKIEREFEQLELPFEDLMIAAAETDATPIDEADTAAPADPVDVRGFRGTRAARHAVRFWRQRSVGTLP
ncbi:MAG: hypothetical protein Q7J57_07405, partial [Gemmobacter sp.]|nr:hypothetical protein [Gemmobacter sp.]